MGRPVNEGRCFRAWDASLGMWLHVPYCAGAANGGPDQCTCSFPGSDLDRARAEIERLKEALHESRQEIARERARADRAEKRRREIYAELSQQPSQMQG